jgi:hypothetical protein
MGAGETLMSNYTIRLSGDIILTRMKLLFNSKFSVADCLFELKKHTKKGLFLLDNSFLTILTFWDGKKYYFNNNGNTFRLERVYYRNIYRPVFVGKLVAQQKGTKIEGYIKTPTSAKVFEIVWFTSVGVIGLFFIYGSIRQFLTEA